MKPQGDFLSGSLFQLFQPLKVNRSRLICSLGRYSSSQAFLSVMEVPISAGMETVPGFTLQISPLPVTDNPAAVRNSSSIFSSKGETKGLRKKTGIPVEIKSQLFSLWPYPLRNYPRPPHNLWLPPVRYGLHQPISSQFQPSTQKDTTGILV